LVLQSNPQDTLKPNNQEKPASQLPFLSRLKWATSLILNARGVSWNCVVPGLRYPQGQSRQHFVLSQLSWAAFFYLLGDVLSVYTRRNPAFQYPPSQNFGAQGLLRQAINVMSFWTLLIASMNRNQVLYSAVSVAIGMSNPEDWPAFFGVWSQTKSVRTFWGKSWHQFLRRSIQPQSKYFTHNILHLRPKSLQSTYTQLFLCFFLSGTYHALGDWLIMRNVATAMANINFFVLQAAFVTFEDFLGFVGKEMGVTTVPTILSYAWIMGWMAVSSPMWMQTMISANTVGFTPTISMVEMLLDKFSSA
ncbi:membrane bound O-acyl transferase family-domain-containing protein, partial [Cyathus striatus]